MENRITAELLRNVAIAYEIGGESPFRIRAYRQAADSIENYPTDIKLVWKQGDLQKIPGVGGSIAQHLDELYSTGNSSHFDEILGNMPSGMYDLLKLRGVGPKTAFTLSRILNKPPFKSNKDVYTRLELALNQNVISSLEGFGKKSQDDIAVSLLAYKEGVTKKKRLRIDEATEIVNMFTKFVQLDSSVYKIGTMGSIRRRKNTIGDIDIALVTTNKKATIDHINSYQNLTKVVDVGNQGMTILLHDGTQIDIRFADKNSWGSMMQYFTGSKYHNIALREFALKQRLSLNEHGIKNLTDKNITLEKFSSEEKFYNRIGLSFIEPELREDNGEVDASAKGNLPTLVQATQIRGDLHIHPNFDFPSSHDIGKSTIEELMLKAYNKGYEYIALADHNPKKSLSDTEVIDIINRRNKEILSSKNTKSVQNDGG